ncbi:MAG: UvrD-helicase domain-containing protein [Planctomycetota bacterium]
MTHALTLCGAGAGSGKTYSICEYLLQRILAHDLDPGRILVTTFTIKAAAELKGRILARLLSEDSLRPDRRQHLAERLELACIGTVDAVGYQLLSRYALHLGLSPHLQVADEEASPRYLRQALQRHTPSDTELEEVALRLGQTNLDEQVLELLECKRGNGIDDAAFRDDLDSSAARLCQILATNGPLDSIEAPEHLQTLATEALAAIDQVHCSTEKTRKARLDLQRLARGGSGSWSDFAKAARLSAGKKSGADECLTQLRRFGFLVRRQPALHADIHAFLRAIADRTIELELRYQSYKEERGLVDFTDLEVQLLELLRHPTLAASVAAEFDVVVVDEFQDTNPLQLAIFVRLRELVANNYWVGDPKQAIYSFRGSDAALMLDVWEHAAEATHRTLTSNWRSQQQLVEFVGTLFQPAFGDDAILEPQRGPIPASIHRWLLTTKRAADDAYAIAEGVATLQACGTPLHDVAILTRTHKQAHHIGEALRDIGVATVVELPGLLGSRECRIAMAALRLVADRYDSVAAATILHLLSDNDDEHEWLTQRLERLQSERDATLARVSTPPWPGHKKLAPLEALRERAATLAPSEVVAAVIGTLELDRHVARWGSAATRCSHLDALLEHAQRYQMEAREGDRPATLTGLVGHLEELAAREEDTHGATGGLEAATVMTYHGAKGLEWPTVILTGLDWQHAPKLWEPTVTGGDPTAVDPLAGREIRFWPWPFGTHRFQALQPGTELEQDAAAAPEGLRAEADEIAEAERLLYVGMTRARDQLILAHREGKSAWLDLVVDLSRVADQITTSKLAPTRSPAHTTTAESWIDVPRVPRKRRHARPAVARPSAERADPVSVTLQTWPLPQAPTVDVDVGETAELLGDAVHSYFAALPSLRALDDNQRAAVAAGCLRAHNHDGVLAASVLVAAGQSWQEWINSRHGECRSWTETPITAPRAPGAAATQWHGNIDLLLERSDGRFVVVDHKSAVLPQAAWGRYAAHHAGQLRGYRDALLAHGYAVEELLLHMPLSGVVLQIGESTAAPLAQTELF